MRSSPTSDNSFKQQYIVKVDSTENDRKRQETIHSLIERVSANQSHINRLSEQKRAPCLVLAASENCEMYTRSL